MRHLVIGQRQKAPTFSAFHWSPHGCLITIGQYFVTTRVVYIPKRTETSLITESDQSKANHQLLQLCTVRTAWSDSDQTVRAVHSCKCWFITLNDQFYTILSHASRSTGIVKMTLQSTVKEKRRGRRRAGKTILKSGQEWTLPAQLWQLKTGQFGKVCCEVICCAPTTF